MGVRAYRKIHRYLGIVIGIQLLLWTGSGFFFSLNSIEKVRGETEQAEASSLYLTSRMASPDTALRELENTHGEVDVFSVLLRPHLDGDVFEIAYRQEGAMRWALADTATGHLRHPIDRDEAVSLARQDFRIQAEIAAVDLISVVEPDSEYRDHPLPAYRVTFDHPLGTRIYVSADRGVVTARRNDQWRWFDLMWMFHIMDYNARDDFNTLWLQLVSGLGLVTVSSGFVLAAVTSPRLRRLAKRTRQRDESRLERLDDR